MPSPLKNRFVLRPIQAYLKTYQLGKKEEDWLAITTPPKNTRDGQSSEVLFIEQGYKFLKEFFMEFNA